ncbi:MAG: efflux RND transporter periplasmic adaptor subunit [Planctomycetia bacterium]|nr:MAG: efflux RND transporter periplasmic adaptor subunit [Planctomycetia bacterium]
MSMNVKRGLGFGRIGSLIAVIVAHSLTVSMARGQPAMARAVEVAAVERELVAPTIQLVGTVRPRIRTIVATEIAGLVSELPVEEGDSVKKGDVLCRLRETQRQLALDESKARLSELGDVIVEREAMLRKTEFEAQRMEGLYKLERCTEKEFRDAREEYEAAKGRHQQAVHAHAAYQATVDRMADDVSRMTIRAPCDGFVVSKQTEIGSWVELGGAVVELIDLSTVKVRVSAPESAAPWCEPGEPVVVHIDALGRSFDGKIARRVPDADPQARTVPIEVDVPNAKAEILAGMFARVAVPNGPRRMAPIVPKDAVVVRGAQQMVFSITETAEGFLAVPVSVKIESELADRVSISGAGVEALRAVVIRGNEYLFGPTPVGLSPESAAMLKPARAPTSQPTGPTTQPVAPKRTAMIHDFLPAYLIGHGGRPRTC